MSAVEVVALRKAYGKKVVLDGLDLIVPAGSVFALLGPNGAGKTTAVHIMSTLIRADSGRVLVAGHDGTGIGHIGWLAAGWCAGLTALGYVWARNLYNRDPA